MSSSPLNIEGGPTQEQIDAWKKEYGDVWVAEFGSADKYIYRAMKRFEYKQIIGNPDVVAQRSFTEERVVQTCVLCPKVDASKIASDKAGTISTLCDLIMSASNFGITAEPIKL